MAFEAKRLLIQIPCGRSGSVIDFDEAPEGAKLQERLAAAGREEAESGLGDLDAAERRLGELGG